jgi:hypothetical protein
MLQGASGPLASGWDCVTGQPFSEASSFLTEQLRGCLPFQPAACNCVSNLINALL